MYTHRLRREATTDGSAPQMTEQSHDSSINVRFPPVTSRPAAPRSPLMDSSISQEQMADSPQQKGSIPQGFRLDMDAIYVTSNSVVPSTLEGTISTRHSKDTICESPNTRIERSQIRFPAAASLVIQNGVGYVGVSLSHLSFDTNTTRLHPRPLPPPNTLN